MAQFNVPRQARMVIAIKPETTAGVDILGGTYVTGDVIPVIADSVRFTQDRNEIINRMTAGNLGRAPSILGPLTARLEFSMFFRGRGVAYASGTRPEIDLPMRACRLSSTVDATGGLEKVTWQPTNTEELMTMYFVIEIPGGTALSIQMVGCLGDFSVDMAAGGLCRFTFVFQGALEERADVTYTGGTLALTPQFPTAKSAAFQIGATNYAPRIANIRFGMGNVHQVIESINASGGIAGYTCVDRDPRLTIDPEAGREADSGWWTALATGGPLKDCTFQIGAAQYNRLLWHFGATDGNQLQVTEQGIGSRGEIVTMPTTLLATISAGNDDFSLVAS